jgi:hypothetical protein
MNPMNWVATVLSILGIVIAIMGMVQNKMNQQSGQKTIIAGLVIFIAALIFFGCLLFITRQSETPSVQIASDANTGGTHIRPINAQPDQVRAIRAVILAANQAGFKAYKTLPTIRTEELKKYYAEGGSAYGEIVDLLNRSHDKGQTIGNPGNPSRFEVISVSDDIAITRDTAAVHTTEYWHLNWYAPSKKAYIANFDRPANTPHTYILRQVGTDWKIESDQFK